MQLLVEKFHWVHFSSILNPSVPADKEVPFAVIVKFVLFSTGFTENEKFCEEFALPISMSREVISSVRLISNSISWIVWFIGYIFMV